MKNIHIIPTDKPSRLACINSNYYITTSVEWLVDYIENQNKNGYEFHPKYNDEIIEQAKKIEKEQQGYSEDNIVKAFDEGIAYETQGIIIRGKDWIKTHKKEWFKQFKNK